MAKQTKTATEKQKSAKTKSNSSKDLSQDPLLDLTIDSSVNIPPIIGIGTSAGGLEALKQFFAHVPDSCGLAFVIIQHLDPTHKSTLPKLLQSFTSMTVFQVENQMKIKSDFVYVLPPNKHLAISNGVLELYDFEATCKQPKPIDFFFRTLAEDRGKSAIGVIFSGMGSDGTLGFEAIKRKNGLTLVQDPSFCEFDAMPRSAIDAGLADIVAPAQELPGRIIGFLKYSKDIISGNPEVAKKSQSALKEIVALLYKRTGSDFSQYKKSTLYRRIERRMKLYQIDTIAAYVQYLTTKPQEQDLLFKELLINVTSFFRDAEMWEYLKTVLFPTLLATYPAGRIFRVWIPACASGEEAYGLAIVFKEVLDQCALQEQYSLKIFATDLDQEAVNQARQGFYPASIATDVSLERLSRFFITHDTGYQVTKEIREMIVFASQNIITDIPFSKLDMLSCRNLLIYLDRELQEKLLPLFHYALNPDGILLLGTAETIDSFPNLFAPLDSKLRIYRRINNALLKKGEQSASIKYSTSLGMVGRKAPEVGSIERLSDQFSMQGYSPATVMVHDNGEILYVRTSLDDHLKAASGNVSDQVHGATLESLMKELQLAREEIHAAHEEMQTSQEELRSSNEELQSTNEELQFANKELQFANDALTSSKTKLHLLNEELQDVNAELTTYIEAIGQLALVSVAGLDGCITQANDRFCEISGYSRSELIGQDHRILNSGEHPKAFFVEMWATIAHGKIWHKEICNRRKNGSLYWVDSTIVPLKDNNGRVVHYISVRVDITARKQKELVLQERLKERSCLYAIHCDMAQEYSVNELCNLIVKHVTLAMQFPELAVCIIKINDKQFTSANYKQNLTHGLFTDIKVDGKICGQLQVSYTEDKPFLLPDEQNFINFVGGDLCLWLERKQTEQHISHMANHDVLTGLPNRLLLQDRISQALAHNHRQHGKSAVLFIDLDHFKIINDSLGHSMGDLLLKEVAARLLSSIRSEDTAARQGGDEFIVVLPHIVEINDVKAVADKILHALKLPYQINEKELHIGGSIGIALYPSNGKDVDTLLKHSDAAMYHAKATGRNNYQFFTSDMNRTAMERHDLGIDLRSALRNDEFLLYFQPVVGIVSGQLESMEVLLRWRHPKKGLISPVKFISLAEETGLIFPIGEWVIKSTCLQIKAWKNIGLNIPRMAINLSAKQFSQKTLVKDIQRILNEYEVSPDCLTLEITESMLMDNVNELIKTLSQLSSMGLKISIDDFGTGYSSLSYLKYYTIDTLKIDRSFIRDIATDENDVAIVTATIAMARSLKMSVIAEGVETEEQITFLTQQGCDQYQGYYFSKPLSASKIESKLRKWLAHNV